MTERQPPRRHHVGPIDGLTEEELRELGRDLYDRITGGQAMVDTELSDFDYYLSCGCHSSQTDHTCDPETRDDDEL